MTEDSMTCDDQSADITVTTDLAHTRKSAAVHAGLTFVGALIALIVHEHPQVQDWLVGLGLRLAS